MILHIPIRLDTKKKDATFDPFAEIKTE